MHLPELIQYLFRLHGKQNDREECRGTETRIPAETGRKRKRMIKPVTRVTGFLLWTSVRDAEGGTKNHPLCGWETRSYTKEITFPVR